MTPEVAAAIAVISVLIAAGSSLVNGRATWRKESREQQAHSDAEADRTIDLLKEQNDLLAKQNEELRKQGEQREAEWRKREAEWTREKKMLESRVSEVERDYRNLVLTVTSMGYCADAAKCKNYNPGDRRTQSAI